MEQITNASEKFKKTVSLKTFFEAKRIDVNKIRDHFIENCSNIPQELRLIIWKIFLGWFSKFSFIISNKSFSRS